VRFDNLADAEQAVFGLQRAWPGTEWQINEVGWPGTKWQASKTPELYRSADLKQWITSSLAAPM
jgi:hypothetical protein